jgi:hypothetical protein
VFTTELVFVPVVATVDVVLVTTYNGDRNPADPFGAVAQPIMMRTAMSASTASTILMNNFASVVM